MSEEKTEQKTEQKKSLTAPRAIPMGNRGTPAPRSPVGAANPLMANRIMKKKLQAMQDQIDVLSGGAFSGQSPLTAQFDGLKKALVVLQNEVRAHATNIDIFIKIASGEADISELTESEGMQPVQEIFEEADQKSAEVAQENAAAFKERKAQEEEDRKEALAASAEKMRIQNEKEKANRKPAPEASSDGGAPEKKTPAPTSTVKAEEEPKGSTLEPNEEPKGSTVQPNDQKSGETVQPSASETKVETDKSEPVTGNETPKAEETAKSEETKKESSADAVSDKSDVDKKSELTDQEKGKDPKPVEAAKPNGDNT